jgi:O-antigen/teichoic acid export membrane protein
MLPILCLGLGLFYVGQALSTLGMSLNVPRIYLKPKIITGVIAVVGNYFVVRLYGIEGIVYGLVFIGLFYLSSIIIVNKALLVRLKSLTI